MSTESQNAAAAAQGLPSLLLPADVVHELRLALVTDLRSAAEDLVTVAAQLEISLTGDMTASRTKIVEQTTTICHQRELHKAVGFPGDPLQEVRLVQPAHLDLAVTLLVEYRGGQAARLTQCASLGEAEKDRITDSVRLLTDFLRQAVPGWPETV